MDNRQIEIRRKKPPYTNIQNKLIWDEALRPQTKWVLIAMLSLPDDWDYSVRGLAAKTKLSKDTIAKMMAELELAGYLMRKPQAHGGKGRFGLVEYILTDVAFDFGEPSPCPSLPYTVEPCTVNSPQQNKDKQTKEQQNPIAPQRNYREVPKEVSDRILEYAPEDTDLQKAIFDFLENRRAANRKPVKTLRAINGILRDLDNHSGGNRQRKLLLLEKATLSNWLTVYPLKADELPTPSHPPSGSVWAEDPEVL